MEQNIRNNHKTIATCLHLLSFGKWLIPFGNFILPILLWMITSNRSRFIDHHGKQVLNFQLSTTLYTIGLSILGAIIILIAIFTGGIELWQEFDGHDFPFKENMGVFATILGVGILIGGAIILLQIVDLVYTIRGAMQANDGVLFKYPLTIPFLSTTTESNNETT